MQELIHRIQFYNDEKAFNELYVQNVPGLYSFSYSFVSVRETAEELVNDVFLKLWMNRKQLSPINNIKVYLYVSVKNASLNYLRKQRPDKTAEPGDAYIFYFPPCPEQVLIGLELQQKIEKAVNSLPPKCRLIFKMVKEDGLSCKEVADILELSHKTVFAQLSIALKKLESILLPTPVPVVVQP